MYDDNAYLEPQHSQNNLFKYFQEHLDIFGDTDAYSATLKSAQLGGEGRPKLPFLKIAKSDLNFERKDQTVSIFGTYFSQILSKRSFESIQEKQIPKCFPAGPLFLVFLTKSLSICSSSTNLLHPSNNLSTLCNPRIFTTLPYSEPQHIQNRRLT